MWHGERRIATLEARRPWDLRCRYEPDVIDHGDANRPLLSCSLPVVRGQGRATPWVRGLLPEGNHLLALATRAGVPTNDYADLLARFGRDIAGAFAISTEPPARERWAVEPYDDDELAAELRLVLDAPGFAIRDDSELSIAGLQNKLLVCAIPGARWGRPVNGRPSTHIMKLADDRHEGLLAAEHACMRLASAAGLTAATTTLLDIDGVEVLTVERYDRAVDATTGDVRRIHQEDACQALGVNIDADRGRGKYERFGGPTFRQIAALLDRYGDPANDLPALLRLAVFTWAIGNVDAHGKNVSLLIDTDRGALSLAPLYDTVPTVLWPNLRPTLAMSINGKDDDLRLDDFITEARTWGVGRSISERVISSTVTDLDAALEHCEHDAVADLVVSRLRILATA